MFQYPSLRECFMVESAIAAVQFGALLVMAVRTRRRAQPEPWTPAVSVIIPCKGALPSRVDNLRSMVNQHYGGPVEFLLVTARRDDPAFSDIEKVAREDVSGRTRALVSDARPVRCAEKNINIIYGVAQSAARSEVLVFSGEKHLAPEGWLGALVTGLHPARVGVASILTFPFPRGGDYAGLCHTVWFLLSAPYFFICPVAIASSCAIRRRDYEDWKVADHWLRSLADDAVVTILAWKHKKSIVAVPRAAGLRDRTLSLSQVVSFTTRYMFCGRIFIPWLWLGAAASGVAKVIVLIRALCPSPSPALLTLFAVSELGFPVWTAWLTARRFPHWKDHWSKSMRPIWIWTALAAPAAWALFLINCVLAAIGQKIVWGGVPYKVRGKFDVEVEN